MGNESLKSLRYYQSIADAFHTGAPDCVPIPLDITKFNTTHNEFNVYFLIVNRFRQVLPLYVSEIPYIEATIADLALEAQLSESELEKALNRLEQYHNLIEITRQNNKVMICLLDITQVANRKRVV